MKDILKQVAGYLAVAIVAFLTGLIVALNTAGQSCYLNVTYGLNENGTPKEISILKPDITDYDYGGLPDHKASALCTKIGNLKYDNALSKELRNLRDKCKGPFESHDIEVFIKFTDDSIISGQIAGAYSGELLNKEINITSILEPKNIIIDEMKDFKVLVKKPSPSNYNEAIDGKTIWICKKFAQGWLKTANEEEIPNKLMVRANIIRTVVYQESLKVSSQSQFAYLSGFFAKNAPK